MIDILKRWIRYCRETRHPGTVDFLLLLDFAEGGIWSDDFYRELAPRALGVLAGLNKDKPEARLVYDELEPVVMGYLND